MSSDSLTNATETVMRYFVQNQWELVERLSQVEEGAVEAELARIISGRDSGGDLEAEFRALIGDDEASLRDILPPLVMKRAETARAARLREAEAGPSSSASGGNIDGPAQRPMAQIIVRTVESTLESLNSAESPQALCEAVEGLMASLDPYLHNMRPGEGIDTLMLVLEMLLVTFDHLLITDFSAPSLLKALAEPSSDPSSPPDSLDALCSSFLVFTVRVINLFSAQTSTLRDPSAPNRDSYACLEVLPSAAILADFLLSRGVSDDKILFYFFDRCVCLPLSLRDDIVTADQLYTLLQILQRSISFLNTAHFDASLLLKRSKLVLIILSCLPFSDRELSGPIHSQLRQAFPEGSASFAPGLCRTFNFMYDFQPNGALIEWLSFFFRNLEAFDALIESGILFEGISTATLRTSTLSLLEEASATSSTVRDKFQVFLSYFVLHSPSLNRMFASSCIARNLISDLLSLANEDDAEASHQLLALLLSMNPAYRLRILQPREPEIVRSITRVRTLLDSEDEADKKLIWERRYTHILMTLREHLGIDPSKCLKLPPDYAHRFALEALGHFLPSLATLCRTPSHKLAHARKLENLMAKPLEDPFIGSNLLASCARISYAIDALRYFPFFLASVRKTGSNVNAGPYFNCLCGLDAFYRYLEAAQGNGWVYPGGEGKIPPTEVLLPPLGLLVDLCFETCRALRALELHVSWERSYSIGKHETRLKKLEEKSRRGRTAGERLKAKSELRMLQKEPRPARLPLPEWAEQIPHVRRQAQGMGKRMGVRLQLEGGKRAGGE